MTDLVLCSLEAWDEVWRRNQYLISGLLEQDSNLRVLFVEPPLDPVHELTNGRHPSRARGLVRRHDLADGRLWTLQSTKYLPRRVGRAADTSLDAAILRTVRRLQFDRPVLWVNDPARASLLTRCEWPALYDITDDWLRADRPQRELDRLRRNEATLMHRCRQVVVCSPDLERVKGTYRQVTLIRNAVDAAAYRRPVARPDDLPSGRCAVYVGTLHEDRLDVDLCVRLARRLTGCGHLVLVGPNALAPINHQRLTAASVRILGSRPYTAVPGYLQHADALVVPHVVTPFTESLDPIKLYEYLVIGRPIVSTPVAGFRDHPGITVGDADGFVDRVVDLCTATQLAPGAGAVAARVPTWAERVEQMIAVLRTTRDVAGVQ